MVPPPPRAPGVSGVVHQVSVSPGGVPKLAIESGHVGPLGLLDDGHTEVFDGGADKALCLYSLEVTDDLAHEDHSQAPGVAG